MLFLLVIIICLFVVPIMAALNIEIENSERLRPGRRGIADAGEPISKPEQ